MNGVSARRFRFAPVLTATVLTVLLLWLLGAAAGVFLLLFLGILLSLYLGALTEFLMVRMRMPQQLALIMAIAISALGIVGLFWLLVPPVMVEMQALLLVLPDYITQWEAALDNFLSGIPGLAEVAPTGDHRILQAIYDQVTTYFRNIGGQVFGLVHAGISIFAVLVMGIYLTQQPGMYREWLIALFPPVHRDLVRDVLGELHLTLRAWIVGQLLAMVVLGALTAVGLYLLDVPYALVFGIFTGAVAIVPFFGTLVSTILPAMFVLGGDGIWGMGPIAHGWLVILLGVVVHAFESNIVIPRIMQHQVELPPVLTITAVLIFGKLLGAIGLIVAVPALASIMVIVRRIIINRVYMGQGFRRTPRDRVLVLRVPPPHGGVLVSPQPEVDLVTTAEYETATGRRIA